MPLPKLYTDLEAAEILSPQQPLKKNTLAVWRSTNQGPNFVRIGRRVFYTEVALQEFIRHRTRKRRRPKTSKPKPVGGKQVA